jgi:hypothetical protein
MSGINMGISVYETKDGGLAMKQETFFAVNDNSFQILVSFSPRHQDVDKKIFKLKKNKSAGNSNVIKTDVAISD